MAQKLVPSLPRIKATIGHIPQRLKAPQFTNPRGRLEVLRQTVTRLVREERFEVKHNKAVECRPYMERLLQMAIHRGEKDPYTDEMMRWWIMEEDLLTKIYKVLVPRFKNMEEPYTQLYRLPRAYLPRTFNRLGEGRYPTIYDVGVLELKGNPFPPMEHLESLRKDEMEEFVRRDLRVPNQTEWDAETTGPS